MINLLLLAFAPVVIFCVYMYIRDKYEKEPLNLLATGIIFGAIITAPIIHVENLITLFIPNSGVIVESFYLSFVVASFVEESFKYAILFFLIWKNNNFNERLDGIVYAVFISLGFAWIENIMYVLNPDLGGINTAIVRAFISVPAHGFFGVTMGYYFAMSKFNDNSIKYILFALFVPLLLHGVYDFILMMNMDYLMIIFAVFVVYLWNLGFRQINAHLQLSPFKKSP